MSLMRAHQQRIRDGKTAAAAPTGPGRSLPVGPLAAQNLLKLLDTALAEDVARLKDINSRERKIEVKRDELLPKYREYLDRLFEMGLDHPLIVYAAIWSFDAGDMERGLTLAHRCIDKGLPMPDAFARDMPTFASDAVLEWAERQYQADSSADPYFSAVVDSGWDIPDELRAKLLRLQGLYLERAEDLPGAASALEAALALGAQVKTKLGEIRKRIGKSSPDTGE